MNVPPISIHHRESLWSFVTEPLKNASIFIICAIGAHILGTAAAIPIAGLAAGICLSTLAVKISKKYDLPLLRKFIAQCHKTAKEYKLTRIILVICVVIAGHWLPLAALAVAIPLNFVNGICAAYRIRRTS